VNLKERTGILQSEAMHMGVFLSSSIRGGDSMFGLSLPERQIDVSVENMKAEL
jgi:hypothetical protein